MKNLNVTGRTKVNRLPKRAAYDTGTIYNILDESFICHVGFNIQGQAYVIPTNFGRKDDHIFIHGSRGSRMLNALKNGHEACITVTLVDGLVLARSAFHHSVNYRSVILFGKGREITGKAEKTGALKIILEHIMPGRWDDVRKPNMKELNITSVFSFKIDEASAKIRNGPVIDDKEDLNLNIWAGILPLRVISAEPVRDKDLDDSISIPGYINTYTKKEGKC